MKKTILLLLAIFAVVNMCNAQNFLQKGADINGEAANNESGRSVSMPDNNTVAIGAINNDGNGTDAGHVRIYRWNPANGGIWVQKGNDIDGESANDLSGFSVSMPDSNTIAIGAVSNDGAGSNSGHVRIYRWNSASGGTWVQIGTDIDGEAADDGSGGSISMPDSNTVAIGATSNNGNGNDAGHVRIYRWDGNVWVQKGNDIDGEALGDFSGKSVSMPDSNTVAIGASGNDGIGISAGHVRIYNWNGTTWVQKGIDIDGEAAYDLAGNSVSMPDSNTVAIGANRNDGSFINAGHVRIYSWNGSVWVQKGIDIDGEAYTDESGISISMPDSNTVAIGTPYNNGNGTYAGHVRIYYWNPANGGTWLQKGIDIDGEAALNYSGYSVSMPDSITVAIGAPFNVGTGSLAGHARVYTTVNNVGVWENNFSNIIMVYPNPTNGELSIDLGTTCNNVSVVVNNILGQVVHNQNFSNSSLLQLNITGEAGVYFIEVRSGDKKAILKVMKE